MEIYYASVGRNCNLLLNVPPDKRGILNENDVRSLMGFRELRNKEFAADLAKGKKVTATLTRGKNFSAANVNDGDPETYWAAPDKVKAASIIIKLGQETEVNRVLIQEYIKLGQRVSRFSVHALVNNEWKQVVDGTTIGHKIIRKFPTVMTSEIKISIDSTKACPVISNIELFRAPGD
jgi:alpha-L-fucosidase